ncbi:hypothetical protein KSI01_00230 [Kurthia sibirica]|nr:hypothetical protein KSI01_00230 [Kurthia sibirica]
MTVYNSLVAIVSKIIDQEAYMIIILYMSKWVVEIIYLDVMDMKLPFSSMLYAII